MSDMFAGALDTAQNYYTDAKNRLFGGGTTTLRFRNCGGVVLDAVTDENHESEMVIADNTLETGTKASDHAALDPKVITVTGTVVGYDKYIGAGRFHLEYYRLARPMNARSLFA